MLDNDAMEDGIDDFKEFTLRSKKVKAVRADIDAGILPVRELSKRFKYFNLFNNEIELGTDFDNLF